MAVVLLNQVSSKKFIGQALAVCRYLYLVHSAQNFFLTNCLYTYIFLYLKSKCFKCVYLLLMKGYYQRNCEASAIYGGKFMRVAKIKKQSDVSSFY